MTLATVKGSDDTEFTKGGLNVLFRPVGGQILDIDVVVDFTEVLLVLGLKLDTDSFFLRLGVGQGVGS